MKTQLFNFFAKRGSHTPPCRSHLILSIFMLLTLLLPVKVWGKMIYLDVSHNDWDADKNATFQIIGDNNSNNWIHLEKVADHIYGAECSYTNIKFERRSANWQFYWNEGPQISVPADKNLYTMSDWAGNGTWSTYGSAGGGETPAPVSSDLLAVLKGEKIMVYGGERKDWNCTTYFFMRTNNTNDAEASTTMRDGYNIGGTDYRFGPATLPIGTYYHGHWASNIRYGNIEVGAAYMVSGVGQDGYTQQLAESSGNKVYKMNANGNSTPYTTTATTVIPASVAVGGQISVRTTSQPGKSSLAKNNSFKYYLFDGTNYTEVQIVDGTVDVSELPIGEGYKILTVLYDGAIYVVGATNTFSVVSAAPAGAEELTSNYYIRGDLWLTSSGWCRVDDRSTQLPKFVRAADNKSATLKVLMPDFRIRLSLNESSTIKAPKDYWDASASNITNTNAASGDVNTNSSIEHLGSTKMVTYTLTKVNGKLHLAAQAADYTVKKDGWKLFVDGTEVGTTDANGEVVVSNLTGASTGTEHLFYFTDGSAAADLRFGVNKFGGLYVDQTNSDASILSLKQYYKDGSIGTFTAPIGNDYDNTNKYWNATGRIKLTANTDVKFTFDGGKITINKVAAPEPAEELTGDWFIMGGHNGWSNNNPEHQMTISAGEATKTYYNVTSQFDFKVYGNGNEHGWSYYSQSKSDVTCTEVHAAISNINLPTITAPTDVTIHYDGRNVWVTTDQHKTFGTNYALAGDFNSWNSTALPLTKINDYTATITQRFEPRMHGSYCSADEGQTKRVKITNSDWKKQIKDVDIDAATSNFMTGTDCQDYDGRILIKVTQPTDVTFTIWKNSSDQMRVTIKAVPVQMHTVKFYDGDTEYTDKAQSVEAGQKPTAPADPTKSGNIFRGWSETNGGEVVDVTTITINADKNFYAKWEAAEVQNIVFHSNYGSEVSNLVVVKGEKATKPADPTKNGNTFLGWYENADFTGSEFDWANTNINKDYELYAKWSYSAIYYLNGSDLGIEGWDSKDWDPNMPKAPLMEDAGDHIEYTVQKAFKMGDDIRFKLVPCNQKYNDNHSCWDNAKGWSVFSSARSTQGVATYKADATNIDIDITAAGSYQVTMCYDGVSVYAIITEVATHTVTYQNGQLSTTREVADGEKATALSMAHRGVEVDWYDNEACTGATFDFNTPITEAKTLYAKSRGASGNYFLTGAIWHNWTNENKTPEMSVADGVATYTFIAPVGQNTIRTLKGSRNEGDYIDARYFDAANSATGIHISDDNKQLYFTIADQPKQVTVTFDGAIRVQIEDYTPHFVDNLFLTANGDWCEVWQANGTKVKTGGWDKKKAENKLRQNGTTGYVILRNVQPGDDRLWKLIGNIDDNSRSGEQLFNAMYVDYTNSVSAAGNFEWKMTNCDALNRQLSYESNEWRNVRFNVKKQCQLKIVFDGGLIRVMDLPQYTVTFNTDGGSAIDAKTVYEEERVSAPASPTKPLYKFVKWQLNGEDFDFANTPITDNITLDAVYEAASFSIHGPLWVESESNHNYRPTNTPDMTNDGTTATVSLVAPKGYQTFGILRDRSYDHQIKPTCDNLSGNVELTRGEDMWFHFTLAEASYITITYTADNKVYVTIDPTYENKSGWYLYNDLKATWGKTAMDNGELIMRDIQPGLDRGYDFKVTGETDDNALAGISYFGSPYVEMNTEDFWQFTHTGEWSQIIPQVDSDKQRYWRNATVKFTEADLINNKLDLHFSFDGKTIQLASVEHVSVICKLAADGETFATQPAFKGNVAVAPANPETRADGAAFIEWRLEGATTAFDWNTPITEDITLVAFWDVLQDRANDAIANSETLTLTHNYFGGNLVVNGDLTIEANGYEIGNLTVKETGNLTINGTLKVQDFTIESSQADHKSGQVFGANYMTVQGNAYFDLKIAEPNGVTYGWYAFTVPFEVSSTQGVYNANTGLKWTNDRDYAIMQYQGAVRAQGKYGWIKTHKVDATLHPGTLYIVSMDDESYNNIRFVKKAGARLCNGTSVAVQEFAINGGEDGKDNGWNGVGNATLTYANASLTDVSKAQVLDHENNVFTLSENRMSSQSFIVGAAFMVQVPAAGIMSFAATATPGSLLAPNRVAARQTNEMNVRLKVEDNETIDDQLYLSASDEASFDYEVGHDLLKFGAMGTAAVAQMSITGYNNMALCDAEFPFVGNQAVFPLHFTAPKTGEYVLYLQDNESADADLYLLYNNRPIWNLTLSEYYIDLQQGDNSGYSLMLVDRKKVTTDIENLNDNEGVEKLLINGTLYIRCGAQWFDATGKMMK